MFPQSTSNCRAVTLVETIWIRCRFSTQLAAHTHKTHFVWDRCSGFIVSLFISIFSQQSDTIGDLYGCIVGEKSEGQRLRMLGMGAWLVWVRRRQKLTPCERATCDENQTNSGSSSRWIENIGRTEEIAIYPPFVWWVWLPRVEDGFDSVNCRYL